ncbi:MAG: transcription elongation factor GreA, partial [Thermoplasmata archaeon]|nr:transcription elongation factor GreA [Thermoplasmata archaeon]
MKEVCLTKEGLIKLKEELFKLKSVSRREIAERIKEAKAYGDLSENSEYEDAKEQQAFVEGRILELESLIKNAKIIKKSNGDQVSIGSKVTLQNGKEKEVFLLVDRTEVAPNLGKISFDSPLG